jgi:hypothetical protein
MNSAHISLDLSSSAFAYVSSEAERSGTTVEQWLQEDLERRSILHKQTEQFFEMRRARAIPGAFERVMQAVPDVPPMPGDELP